MDCWKSSSELKSYVISNLRKLGIKPSQNKGQNFLINSNIIKYQIDKAEISSKDNVLEIGAGLGNLTKCIIAKAKKTFVIELDNRLVRFLRDEFSSFSNFEIISGDAVKVDFPSFNKCVSNLPYQISSPITFKLLEHQFENAILMYQREFAQRIFADPGTSDYSRLSVMINLKADCEYLKTIKPSSFLPPPKVHSSLVLVRRKGIIQPIYESNFNDFVTLLFSNKKKIVRSVLLNNLKRKLKSNDKLKEINIEPILYSERRIFTLTKDELINLYNNLRTKIGEDLWLDIISLNTN